MTSKDFRNHMDLITRCIHKSVEAYNASDFHGQVRAESETVQRVSALLSYFGISEVDETLSHANFIIHRSVSLKKDGDNEKSFHVSDSVIRSFIKKDILGKYAPEWEQKLEKAGKPSRLEKKGDIDIANDLAKAQKEIERLQKKTEMILAEQERRKNMAVVTVNGKF